jgi:Cu-processing system permease protein
MKQIIKFILVDILRNKIVLAYAILLALLSWSAFNLEDTGNKGLLTLLNIVLLVVPLVSVLFSTIYIYNSAEFIELLVSQPVKRQHIWISLYLGLACSLSLAFILSAGIPLLLFANLANAIILILTGCLISLVFISIAFLAAILSRDKAKGIGIAIMLWLYFALLFDGLVLFIIFQFADYPIEKPMVLLSATSPIDLARILNLLELDASAMMGYTGAIFKEYFGTSLGFGIAIGILGIWIITPFYISLRVFKKKDL